MKRQENLTPDQVAALIDHAVLKPELTEEKLIEECYTAREHGAATVCVRPYDVRRAAEVVEGSSTGISAVVGFPHGNSVTGIKVEEAERAMQDGAVELDVVAPVGKIRSGAWEYLEQELEQLTGIIHPEGGILKVILENYYLSREQIMRCCMIGELLEVDYVKTSTGFAPTGARLEDVQLMREACSERVKIKAAGGIRTLKELLEFYQAGADRIGTSSTAGIIREAREKS